MRIQLSKNFNYIEVAEWMEKYIGPVEEGVTWFWSTNDDLHEGIKLYKDCPEATMAMLKWSI
jgi:hypothetical protein